LSDYSLELVTKIGNYSGLGNKLSKYKELLQKLSKIDEDAAKIKFNDIDSKLDSYDSDFRYWLHKVESNRKDKRKTSDSLKKFQKNVNRFTNIFHEFSYSGWLP
jgi:chromosome segregation ATPase